MIEADFGPERLQCLLTELHDLARLEIAAPGKQVGP